MKGEKSFTRHQYKIAYRLFRRGYAYRQEGLLADTGWDILKAADYSYQAKDYVVHGWSNNMRHAWFKKTMWRILTQREVFPF